MGRASLNLADLVAQAADSGGKASLWVTLQPVGTSYTISSAPPLPTGDLLLDVAYKVRARTRAQCVCRRRKKGRGDGRVVMQRGKAAA